MIWTNASEDVEMRNRWWRFHSEIAGTKRFQLFRENMTAGLMLLIVLPMVKEGYSSFVQYASICFFLLATGSVVVDLIKNAKEGKSVNGWSVMTLFLLFMAILLVFLVDHWF